MDAGQLIATLIGTISFLAGTIGVMGKLMHRMLTDQVTECKAENKGLRDAAHAAIVAKDRELDEWKRMALGRKEPAS